MSTYLYEHQYELAEVDGTDGLVFGTEDTGYLTLTRPQHASGDVVSNDLNRAGEDGLMMAVDFRGGKSVGFEIGVLTDVNNKVLDTVPSNALAAHQQNLDALEALEAMWNDPKWRETPRSVAMLRACEAGRTSRAYGRPRRYDEVVGNLTRVGYSTVVCDFQMVDDRWYSDVQGYVEAGLPVSADGGLVAPIVSPITTQPEAQTERTIVVGGKRPTWLSTEFVGPVMNPSVTIGSMTIGLTGSLGAGVRLRIDPEPWMRTALRSSDGASLAGLLSRGTPAMSAMLIKPGSHLVTFKGTDATGTARVRLRWRDARSRP